MRSDEMSFASDQIGVAIAGCGYWGMNYVRVFSELAESRVVAVCDQRADRLKEVERRLPAVRCTTEIQDLLVDPAVDAVVICTNATSHYGIARRCLAARKHILVEKPMATASSQAEELVVLGGANMVTLMVGHTFIYNTGIRKVRDYLKEAPENIYYLHARRMNLGPIRSDVNALWDLATHDIAIFNYLLDSVPEWVSAVGGKILQNCREDVGFVCLGYPNNVLGHIHVSWADPSKTREVVAVCSDRRIVFDDLNAQEQVRVFEKGVRAVVSEPLSYGEHQLQIRDGDILSPKVEAAEPLKKQCRHFLECISTGSRPLTGGREGRDVLMVLEAIDESIKLNGSQVMVDTNGCYAHIAA
jgi:predicted dehydrogenase